MKNAARKREQNKVHLSYAEREQYRCEVSMLRRRDFKVTQKFTESTDCEATLIPLGVRNI